MSWRLHTLLGLLLLHAALHGQVELPNAKPVPLMQAVPQPRHQVSFQRDGVELTRLHFDPADFRPFVFPIIGPSGRTLTRMGHPHDPVGHSHHNSVWLSHHDVNGAGFWNDQSPGRIVVQRLERLDDGAEEAAALTTARWEANGKVLLQEIRRTAARTLPNKEWFLLIDLILAPPSDEPVVLGKTPFGLIGARMAKTIGVHDGGGMIRNSEGAVNEKEVFWKPARWVDYSGPVTSTTREGVTLMDHPGNPRHPAVFHVRDDGWMGAALSFHEPLSIPLKTGLRLRYGLYVHGGVPESKEIQRHWEEFAKLPLPDLHAKKPE